MTKVFFCSELWEIILNYMPIITIKHGLPYEEFIIQCKFNMVIKQEYYISFISIKKFNSKYVCSVYYDFIIRRDLKSCNSYINHMKTIKWDDKQTLMCYQNKKMEYVKLYYPKIIFMFDLIKKLGLLNEGEYKYYYKNEYIT